MIEAELLTGTERARDAIAIHTPHRLGDRVRGGGISAAECVVEQRVAKVPGRHGPKVARVRKNGLGGGSSLGGHCGVAHVDPEATCHHLGDQWRERIARALCRLHGEERVLVG